jgi:hypothetical protein
MPKLKFFIVPLLVFLLISSAAIFLSAVDYSWSQWKPASCMPDDCFCEAIRRSTVAQPSNTWSSFGFVLIGVLIIGTARYDLSRKDEQAKSNPMIRHMAAAALYGISLAIIGVGSAFYHASLTFVGQFFDVMGMYLLAGFILIYNLHRLSSIAQRTFVISYIMLNFILGYTLIAFPILRRALFAMLIIAALIIEHRLKLKKKSSGEGDFIKMALLMLAAAFIFWVLDYTRILCAPGSWLQGHALWHILGALAAGSLYLHYRSENLGNPAKLQQD